MPEVTGAKKLSIYVFFLSGLIDKNPRIKFSELIGNKGLNVNFILNFLATILQSLIINFAFGLIKAGAVIPIKW